MLGDDPLLELRVTVRGGPERDLPFLTLARFA